MEKCAKFCSDCVLSPGKNGQTVMASKVSFKDVKETEVELKEGFDLPHEDLERIICNKAAQLQKEFNDAWRGKNQI